MLASSSGELIGGLRIGDCRVKVMARVGRPAHIGGAVESRII